MNLLEVEGAVRSAGALIRARLGRPERVDLKGRANLATDVDLASERLLRAALSEALPEATFFGEEEGGALGELTWVVDPLDGTTNFVHGYPHVAVSVALVRAGRPVLGTVYDVGRDELYWAAEGQGAACNGQALRVSDCAVLADALLATGPEPLSFWRTMEEQTHGVRRDACASLDFCWVARGRLDGFCEHDLQPWDVAAGLLILTEAGGQATDFAGQPATPWSGDYLISNGRLHAELFTGLTQEADSR